MNTFKTLGLVALVALGLGACTGKNANGTLVFGQATTVGIGVSTAPTPGVTVGYQDINIAIIPVASGNGNGEMFGGTQCEFAPAKDGDEDYQSICDKDTLSVIGQFEANVNADGEVILGKFFATGHSANSISEGFKAQLSKDTDQEPK